MVCFRKKNKQSEDYEKTTIAQDSDIYNMDTYKRGTVIIFNHYEFDDDRIENRKNAEKDVEALKKVLKSLMFDIFTYNDYSYAELYNKLNEGKKFNLVQ